jgi:tetratricopeptide (TPR) repeat protein
MFRTRTPYDRQRILEAAARARAKNQRQRAIDLYRWVLAVERNNADLHARLAPLLAETGQDFDAWNSFRATAHAALREGREDRAFAVYREASQYLPREIQVWQALARLAQRRGDIEEAIEILLEGSRHFRSPFLRPQAIHLLRRARTLDTWHFESVLELAGHLGRARQSEEARILLSGLAARATERQRKRVRAAQMRLDPGLGSLLRWARSTLRRTSENSWEDPLPLAPRRERQELPEPAALTTAAAPTPTEPEPRPLVERTELQAVPLSPEPPAEESYLDTSDMQTFTTQPNPFDGVTVDPQGVVPLRAVRR